MIKKIIYLVFDRNIGVKKNLQCCFFFYVKIFGQFLKKNLFNFEIKKC